MAINIVTKNWLTNFMSYKIREKTLEQLLKREHIIQNVYFQTSL